MRKAFAAAVLTGCAALTVSHAARAEDLSAQQIIDGLKVKRTRSLSGPEQRPVSADDQALLDRVRGRTRSLSSSDRDQLANMVEKQNRPKVNVEVYFDYNSALVTPKAEPQLNSLGQALTSKDLEGTTVLLGGHTDAKGGDEYNQKLSERRAESVKAYLVRHYHIPEQNLIAAGYGKKGLKNTSDPFASENRRVEIVNVAEREQASR